MLTWSSPERFRHIDEFLVETEARREQRRPMDLERDQFLKELHRAGLVTHELAGGEEDVARPALLDLLDDLVGGATAPAVVAVQPPLGAEVTGVGAAARLLDDVRTVKDVVLPVEQIPARRRQTVEARNLLASVEPLQALRRGVREHLWKDLLPFADANGVGVVGHLLVVEGCMGPAHQNGNPFLAEPVGNLEGPE